MKIAVTNHHRKLVGGTESYLNRVIPELEQAGHIVHLFHEADAPPEQSQIAARQASQGFDDLASFRPDVIFNHGLQSPTLEFGLADTAPVVHFAHNYHGTCISGEKTRKIPSPTPCSRCFGPGCLVQYLPRNCGGFNPAVMWADYQTQSKRNAAMRRSKTVVTASDHMRREYLRNGMSHVETAPLFVHQRENPLPDPPSGPLRILFAGRMTKIKGAEVLMKAADCEVTMAGDGPERERLQAAYPRANFPGWMSQTELERLAATHHLFAMPSLWPEPFGLAGLELGLPVAAFSVGGIPEWLTDGYNGALSSTLSSEAFADAIHRCAQIPSGRTNMHNMASRFTLGRHMSILLPILERACES